MDRNSKLLKTISLLTAILFTIDSTGLCATMQDARPESALRATASVSSKTGTGEIAEGLGAADIRGAKKVFLWEMISNWCAQGDFETSAIAIALCFQKLEGMLEDLEQAGGKPVQVNEILINEIKGVMDDLRLVYSFIKRDESIGGAAFIRSPEYSRIIPQWARDMAYQHFDLELITKRKHAASRSASSADHDEEYRSTIDKLPELTYISITGRFRELLSAQATILQDFQKYKDALKDPKKAAQLKDPKKVSDLLEKQGAIQDRLLGICQAMADQHKVDLFKKSTTYAAMTSHEKIAIEVFLRLAKPAEDKPQRSAGGPAALGARSASDAQLGFKLETFDLKSSQIYSSQDDRDALADELRKIFVELKDLPDQRILSNINLARDMKYLEDGVPTKIINAMLDASVLNSAFKGTYIIPVQGDNDSPYLLLVKIPVGNELLDPDVLKNRVFIMTGLAEELLKKLATHYDEFKGDEDGYNPYSRLLKQAAGARKTVRSASDSKAEDIRKQVAELNSKISAKKAEITRQAQPDQQPDAMAMHDAEIITMRLEAELLRLETSRGRLEEQLAQAEAKTPSPKLRGKILKGVVVAEFLILSTMMGFGQAEKTIAQMDAERLLRMAAFGVSVFLAWQFLKWFDNKISTILSNSLDGSMPAKKADRRPARLGRWLSDRANSLFNRLDEYARKQLEYDYPAPSPERPLSARFYDSICDGFDMTVSFLERALLPDIHSYHGAVLEMKHDDPAGQQLADKIENTREDLVRAKEEVFTLISAHKKETDPEQQKRLADAIEASIKTRESLRSELKALLDGQGASKSSSAAELLNEPGVVVIGKITLGALGFFALGCGYYFIKWLFSAKEEKKTGDIAVDSYVMMHSLYASGPGNLSEEIREKLTQEFLSISSAFFTIENYVMPAQDTEEQLSAVRALMNRANDLHRSIRRGLLSDLSMLKVLEKHLGSWRAEADSIQQGFLGLDSKALQQLADFDFRNIKGHLDEIDKITKSLRAGAAGLPAEDSRSASDTSIAAIELKQQPGDEVHFNTESGLTVTVAVPFRKPGVPAVDSYNILVKDMSRQTSATHKIQGIKLLDANRCVAMPGGKFVVFYNAAERISDPRISIACIDLGKNRPEQLVLRTDDSWFAFTKDGRYILTGFLHSLVGNLYDLSAKDPFRKRTGRLESLGDIGGFFSAMPLAAGSVPGEDVAELSRSASDSEAAENVAGVRHAIENCTAWCVRLDTIAEDASRTRGIKLTVEDVRDAIADINSERPGHEMLTVQKEDARKPENDTIIIPHPLVKDAYKATTEEAVRLTRFIRTTTLPAPLKRVLEATGLTIEGLKSAIVAVNDNNPDMVYGIDDKNFLNSLARPSTAKAAQADKGRRSSSDAEAVAVSDIITVKYHENGRIHVSIQYPGEKWIVSKVVQGPKGIPAQNYIIEMHELGVTVDPAPGENDRIEQVLSEEAVKELEDYRVALLSGSYGLPSAALNARYIARMANGKKPYKNYITPSMIRLGVMFDKQIRLKDAALVLAVNKYGRLLPVLLKPASVFYGDGTSSRGLDRVELSKEQVDRILAYLPEHSIENALWQVYSRQVRSAAGRSASSGKNEFGVKNLELDVLSRMAKHSNSRRAQQAAQEELDRRRREQQRAREKGIEGTSRSASDAMSQEQVERYMKFGGFTEVAMHLMKLFADRSTTLYNYNHPNSSIHKQMAHKDLVEINHNIDAAIRGIAKSGRSAELFGSEIYKKAISLETMREEITAMVASAEKEMAASKSSSDGIMQFELLPMTPRLASELYGSADDRKALAAQLKDIFMLLKDLPDQKKLNSINITNDLEVALNQTDSKIIYAMVEAVPGDPAFKGSYIIPVNADDGIHLLLCRIPTKSDTAQEGAPKVDIFLMTNMSAKFLGQLADVYEDIKDPDGVNIYKEMSEKAKIDSGEKKPQKQIASSQKPLLSMTKEAKPAAVARVEAKPVEQPEPAAEKRVEAKPAAEKRVEAKPAAEKRVEAKPAAEKRVEAQPVVQAAPVTQAPVAPAKSAAAEKSAQPPAPKSSSFVKESVTAPAPSLNAEEKAPLSFIKQQLNKITSMKEKLERITEYARIGNQNIIDLIIGSGMLYRPECRVEAATAIAILVDPKAARAVSVERMDAAAKDILSAMAGKKDGQATPAFDRAALGALFKMPFVVMDHVRSLLSKEENMTEPEKKLCIAGLHVVNLIRQRTTQPDKKETALAVIEQALQSEDKDIYYVAERIFNAIEAEGASGRSASQGQLSSTPACRRGRGTPAAKMSLSPKSQEAILSAA